MQCTRWSLNVVEGGRSGFEALKAVMRRNDGDLCKLYRFRKPSNIPLAGRSAAAGTPARACQSCLQRIVRGIKKGQAYLKGVARHMNSVFAGMFRRNDESSLITCWWVPWWATSTDRSTLVATRTVLITKPDHSELAQTEGGSANAVFEGRIRIILGSSMTPRGIIWRGGSGWAKRCTIDFCTHTIPLHSQGARQSRQSRPCHYATASDNNRTSANISFFSLACFATWERFHLPHDEGQKVNLLS